MLKEPMTMPGVGTFAVLSGPKGAVFAPFTPETADPEYGAPPYAPADHTYRAKPASTRSKGIEKDGNPSGIPSPSAVDR